MTCSPVVLITGSSRGIGAATALYFAKHGYNVCINYKADLASAILVAEKVKQLGVEAEVIQGDVSLEADVLALFMHIDKVFGQLDVLGRVDLWWLNLQQCVWFLGKAELM